jgi:hypothetical protein
VAIFTKHIPVSMNERIESQTTFPAACQIGHIHTFISGEKEE